jgi:O-antigen/teichoic acid export membrane protein
MGRLLQDSTLYLIGNLAGRALGFVAIPFYSRFLTPTQYGIIELVELSTTTVAIAFGLQSIGAALSRLYHDQRSPEDERAVVSTGLIGTGALSAAVTALFVLLAAPIGRAVLHSGEWTGLLQAAFVGMFLANLVEVELIYERIRERARFFLAYSLVTLALNIALNVYFIGVLDLGVWGFVASKLCITSVSSVYLMWRAARDVGFHVRGALVPQFVRFGAPLIVSSLAFFAIHFSDRFFLTGAVSLADLGRYALAYRFAMLLSILVGDSFNKSWGVSFYRYAGEAGWQEQFARVAAFLTFVTVLVGLTIAVAAPEVLRVMVPASYDPPSLVLPILVLGYVFREMGDFFNNLLLINRRSVRVGQVAAGCGALNVALNFALIPTHGIYGAAVATLLTWVGYALVCWVIARREHALPIRPSAYARILLLGLGTFALATVLRVPSLPAQLVLDVGWVALFALLCLPLYFNGPERAALRHGAGLVASRLAAMAGAR